MSLAITEQDIAKKLAECTVPSRPGVKTSLAPVTALLEQLNHPEKTFPSIHVGGTSGKGSTATFLSNILWAGGYKVGLFTKPHLQSVRERFLLDRQPIPSDTMMALLERMPAANGEKPTWFELMVALAFQYFADEKVDFGVIEVGLGGLLDATNVITPELSVLTNVGLDHTDILGDTIEKIASDKAGIFKPGKPVISGVSQPSVIEIVIERAAQLGCPLKLLNRDFQYSGVDLLSNGCVFDFAMGPEVISGLTLRMLGEHQVQNASIAVAAALQLNEMGYPISETAIQDGLATTVVPGRMEVLPAHPAILLDGAHSPPKMQALAASLNALFASKERIIGVLAFSKGHDAQETLSHLAPLIDTAILTGFDAETDYGSKRAQEPQEIAQFLTQLNPAVRTQVEPDPITALEIARKLAGPNDLICVTGSIFLVGQVRSYLTGTH